MSKMDVYDALKKALEEVGSRSNIEMINHFMEYALQKGHKNLTFRDLRQIADKLDYEFLLDLLAADQMCKQIVGRETNWNADEELIKRFLYSNSIGRKRAML